MLFLPAIALALIHAPTSGPLARYVQKDDPSFAWSMHTLDGHTALDLKSQTWQGKVWRHDVVFVTPTKNKLRDAAIIEVTGWTPNQKDYDYAKLLADSSGMTVCLLFQIPNQPLFGQEEDGLIALTIERYLRGDGDDWPLLLAMVKSVVATMDAIQESTKRSIKKFVITGASKRGWTAWLTGALQDPRIIGIAPVAFDNLDMKAQLAKQKDDWGQYSPMISDYTDKGLQGILDSPPGRELLKVIDPINYIGDLTIPILTVNGTNDPFWAVDAAQVYWERLPKDKWTVAVPNANHGMGDKSLWAPTIGWFASQCAQGRSLPSVSASERVEANGVSSITSLTGTTPKQSRIWSATSLDLHFEKSVWKPNGFLKSNASGTWTVKPLRTLNQAVFIEHVFENGCRLTTPVTVVKKSWL